MPGFEDWLRKKLFEAGGGQTQFVTPPTGGIGPPSPASAAPPMQGPPIPNPFAMALMNQLANTPAPPINSMNAVAPPPLGPQIPNPMMFALLNQLRNTPGPVSFPDPLADIGNMGDVSPYGGAATGGPGSEEATGIVPPVVKSTAGGAWAQVPGFAAHPIEKSVTKVLELGGKPQHDAAIDMMQEAYAEAKTGEQTNDITFGSILYQNGFGNVQNWALEDDAQKARVVNAMEKGYDLYADLVMPGGPEKKHVLVAHIDPGPEAVLAMFYEDMEKDSFGSIDAMANNLMFGGATDPFTFITFLGPAAHALGMSAEAVLLATEAGRTGTVLGRASQGVRGAEEVGRFGAVRRFGDLVGELPTAAAEKVLATGLGGERTIGGEVESRLRGLGYGAEKVEQAQHLPGKAVVGGVKLIGKGAEKTPYVQDFYNWARTLTPYDQIRLAYDMMNEKVRLLAEGGGTQERFDWYNKPPSGPDMGVSPTGGPGGAAPGAPSGPPATGTITVAGRDATVVETIGGFTIAQDAGTGNYLVVAPGNQLIPSASYPTLEQARAHAQSLATQTGGGVAAAAGTGAEEAQGIADEAKAIIDAGGAADPTQADDLLNRVEALGEEPAAAPKTPPDTISTESVGVPEGQVAESAAPRFEKVKSEDGLSWEIRDTQTGDVVKHMQAGMDIRDQRAQERVDAYNSGSEKPFVEPVTTEPLSPEETAALDAYAHGTKGSNENSVSKAAWNDEYAAKNPQNAAPIPAIESAIAKGSIPADTTLWRGVRDLERHGIDPTPGSTFEGKGFLSTSSDDQVANNFSGGKGGLLKIEVPEGTPAIRVTNRYGEDEILLGRGTKWEVTSVEPRDRGGPLITIRPSEAPIEGADAAPGILEGGDLPEPTGAPGPEKINLDLGAQQATAEMAPPISMPEPIAKIFGTPSKAGNSLMDRVRSMGEGGVAAVKDFYTSYFPTMEKRYKDIAKIDDQMRQQTGHLTSLKHGGTPEERATWFNPDESLTEAGVAESARRKALTESYKARKLKVEDAVEQRRLWREAGLDGEPPEYTFDWGDTPDSKLVIERDPTTGKATNVKAVRGLFSTSPSQRPELRNLIEHAVFNPDNQTATDIRYALHSAPWEEYRGLANDLKALRREVWGEDSVGPTSAKYKSAEAEIKENIDAGDLKLTKAEQAKVGTDAPDPGLNDPYTPETPTDPKAPPASSPATPWPWEPGEKKFAVGLWRRAKKQKTLEAGLKVFEDAAKKNPKWNHQLMVGDNSESARFRKAWEGKDVPPPPPGDVVDPVIASGAGDLPPTGGSEGGGPTIGGLPPAKATLEPGDEGDRLLREVRLGYIGGDYEKLRVGDLDGGFQKAPDDRVLFEKVNTGGTWENDAATGKKVLMDQKNDERLGDIYFRHLDEILEGGALTDINEIKDAAVRATMADLSPNIPTVSRSKFWRALGKVGTIGKENLMYSWPRVPVRVVGDNAGNFWTLVSNGKWDAAAAMVKDMSRMRESTFAAAMRDQSGEGIKALANTNIVKRVQGYGYVTPESVQRGVMMGREEVGREGGQTVLNKALRDKFGDTGRGVGAALSASGMTGSNIGKKVVSAGDMIARAGLWDSEFVHAIGPEYQRFADTVEALAAKGEMADASKLMDGLGGVFSNADVLRLAPEAGFTAGEAEDLARQWRGAVNRAGKAADLEEKRLLFDYRSTNLDDALKKVTFFHYWMTRSAPLYAEAALKNPVLLATYDRMKDELQRQCDRRAGQHCGYLKMFGTESGFAGWFNPMFLISSTLINFEPDFQNPDARMIDRVIDKVPLMMSPILQAGLSATGLSAKSGTDPFMTTAGRRMLTGLINVGQQEGWWGDNKKLSEDQIQKFIDATYSAASAWSEKHSVPFAKRVADKMNNREDVAMMQNNAQDLVLTKHGLDISTNLDDLAKTPEGQAIIEEITTSQNAITSGADDPIANKVRHDWAWANMFKTGGQSFFSGTTMSANTLDTRRVIAAAPQSLSVPDPLKQAVGSQQDFISAGGPEAVALEQQGDEYRGLATTEEELGGNVYNDIVYNPERLGMGLTVGGKDYSVTALQKMTEDERKDLAKLYIAERPTLAKGREDLFAKQDEFKADPTNKQYTDYLDWATKAREIGMETLMQVSPAYKQYIEGLPKETRNDPARLAGAAFSKDAFQFTNGDRPSLYSDEPLAPLDPSQVNPVDFLSKNASTGTDFGPKTKDPALQVIEDMQKWQTESAVFDLMLQQIYHNPDIHWESMIPLYQDGIRQQLAQVGVTPPSKPSSLTKYEQWSWSRTQKGLPSSIQAYGEWYKEYQAYLKSKGIDLDAAMALAVAGKYNLSIDQPAPLSGPISTATATAP